jgi:hypothetical protein
MSTGEVIAAAINYYFNMKLPITAEMRMYAYWWFGITAKKEDEFVLTKEGPIHLFTLEQKIDFGRGLLELAYEGGTTGF